MPSGFIPTISIRGLPLPNTCCCGCTPCPPGSVPPDVMHLTLQFRNPPGPSGLIPYLTTYQITRQINQTALMIWTFGTLPLSISPYMYIELRCEGRSIMSSFQGVPNAPGTMALSINGFGGPSLTGMVFHTEEIWIGGLTPPNQETLVSCNPPDVRFDMPWGLDGQGNTFAYLGLRGLLTP